MLPTDFITNLLQSEKRWEDPYPSKDNSSAISAMTYPPPLPANEQSARAPNHPQRVAQKPNGSRPPPSAYIPIMLQRRPSEAASDTDADTMLSVQGADSKVSDSSMMPGTLVEYGYLPKDKESSEYAASPEPTPSLNGSQAAFLPRSSAETDQVAQARPGYATSIVSKISAKSRSIRSVQRTLRWLKKPLPPVPTLPHITIAEQDKYKKEDEALSFSQLAGRSQMLQNLLADGRHPHHSVDSYVVVSNDKQQFPTPQPADHASRLSFHPSAQKRKSRIARLGNTPRSRIMKLIIIAALILVVIVVVVVAVVVTVSKRRDEPSLPKCEDENRTGLNCDLDSTCVCTGERCDQLAQSLLDLLPTMNEAFATNVTESAMSMALFQAIGAPVGSCARQALLIDVAPGLDPAVSPNRAAWTQAALLWNVAMSQDSESAKQLQDWVRGRDWSSLDASDAPVELDEPAFWIATASGYTFNFAAQTVTPPSASFVEDGQPTREQINDVESTATGVLDRMYAYAKASSLQQENALAQYWRGTLQQDASTMRSFVAAFGSSRVILPVDATWSREDFSVAAQMGRQFPIPMACYPNLRDSQWNAISSFEASFFGLSNTTAPSSPQESCYPERPMYGVLDLLRLGMLHPERDRVPRQSIVLKSIVRPRAVFYQAETLSALPTTNINNTLTSSDTDPRRAGTSTSLNHVLLSYLTSMPSVDIAKQFIAFVSSQAVVPPEEGTPLYEALASLPVVEVAIFGAIAPSDIDFAVSSFATPTNSLFFGTDASRDFRDWVINTAGSYIRWKGSTTVSPLYVRDAQFEGDEIFDATYKAAWDAMHSPGFTDLNVGIANVTKSFSDTRRFVQTRMTIDIL